MKLISCNSCGVILDADKLNFPEDLEDFRGSICSSKADWCSNRREWVAFTPCPVCKEKVLKP